MMIQDEEIFSNASLTPNVKHPMQDEEQFSNERLAKIKLIVEKHEMI